ncbi:hypothetical protein TNCV_2717951 [Trichonephila clavipes]|nr:hypothetical protein TNCV_2717951 [Trichonephila clavipes]
MGFFKFIAHCEKYLNAYLFIQRACWLLDHLSKSLPVQTDDVVNRIFIESSALEQAVAFQSGRVAEWTGHIAARPSQWRYTPRKSCPVVRRKRATESALSRFLEIGATGGSRQYACQYMWI